MTALGEVCLVGASTGNRFMNELLEAIAYEVEQKGVTARVVYDAFPRLEQRGVYVVIPHEFFACAPESGHPTQSQLSRTLTLNVEQPGTPWFSFAYRQDRRAGGVLALQPLTVRELRRRGVRAQLFELGYTRHWDRWHGEEGNDRPTDVLYMGSANARRDRILAAYGGTLWPLESRLLVPPEEPKIAARPDFLVGEEKWSALRASKVLLNVHRQDLPFFEWARVLEAIANGCVVVSERSIDTEPLVPGEHFLSGRAENLASIAAAAVRDEELLRRIRVAAYERIRHERPMAAAVDALLTLAERVAGRRVRAETLPARIRVGGALALENGVVAIARNMREPLKRMLLDDGEVRGILEAQGHANHQIRRLAPAVKRVVLEQLVLRRALDARLLAERGVDADAVIEVAQTPAYGRARPRVSVVIPLFNHAREVVFALRTAAASDFDELEIVVLDDASSDGSAAAVAAFMDERPYLPIALLRHEVNHGLGRTRNDLLKAARGELAFLLDADNELYPPAIRRLVAALDANPDAVFAYAMSERFAGGETLGLLTHLPWEPERLRNDNYIDAMSLVRREEILALGGFTEDLRLYGWEDYDLWCRCADAGRRGVLVPQILFRYREAPGSMISVTDIDDYEMRAVVRSRYPSLMNGGTRTDRSRTGVESGAGGN